MTYRILRILCLSVCFIMIISGSVSAGDGAGDNRYISPSYDGIRSVHDLDTGKNGYIDEEGNIVVPIEHMMAMDFTNGFGLLFDEDGQGGEAYYAVNTKGETVIEFDPELGKITHFDGEYGIASKYHAADIRGRLALIDGKGDLITGYDYYTLLAERRGPGYGVIYAEIVGTEGLRSGTLDKKGNEVIPIEYSYIQNSARWNSNILSVQKTINKNAEQYAWGYFYKDGSRMLPCIYDSVAVFSEGYGYVLNEGKWAIINAYGQFVTGFEFDGLSVFSEGLSTVRKNDKAGAIDTTGKEVIPCIYDYINKFKDGHAIARLAGTEVILENPLRKTRDVNIYFEGKWIYTDQEPIIESGHTLAPLRSIAETLGYIVDWDEETKQITLQNQERIIRLTIGSDEATVNQFDDGKPPKTVLLDVPSKITNGRTLVPVRFLAESTGADVEWDAAERDIKISL